MQLLPTIAHCRPAGAAFAGVRLAPAPTSRRCHRRRSPTIVARAEAGSFAEVRGAAAEAVERAKGKLEALEKAKRTADQLRTPAAEAEQRWQESYGKLTKLQQDVHSVMGQLREAVTAAAGGADKAAHALLARHVQQRLEDYRVNSSLVSASDWKVYRAQDLPLNCIPGGRMMCQLAGAELEGKRYAVVALGLSNPFLIDNLRSLLLHWGCTEGLQAQWTQPPLGWHSAPGVSTPAGDRAWDSVLASFAPELQGEPVKDAALYSVVLQIPLEGALELRGGIKAVLKRTDAGQPEWIKAGQHNTGDFFLDFQPAIDYFEQKRRTAQKVAIVQARAAAITKRIAARAIEKGKAEGELAAATEVAAGTRAASVAAGRAAEVASAEFAAELTAALMEWTMDESMSCDIEEAEEAALPKEGKAAEGAARKEVHIPGWVSKLQFVQLGDYPAGQDKPSMSHQLNNLHRIAATIADSQGDSSPAAALVPRCRELDGMLQQLDLLELSTRAAQQEKEQLQLTYKSASDEASHLMQELTSTAESARRTAVKLRGRETEVTQRDLEAVAEQTSQELVKISGTGAGGGIWPFKDKEERQLVFVQQKVMEVSGMDAAVVVQVFVEGTKAAVQAATAPVQPAATGDAQAAVDAAQVASTLAPTGQDATAAGSLLAAATQAVEAVGVGKKPAAAAVEAKPKKASFEHVVVGISVAEKFPDGGIKTPLIMHAGLVAHQHAKWQPPPEKWGCCPEAVGLSASGSAAQVPFQRYSVSAEDGSPVFVDPTLFALALRLPLKDCIQRGVRGVEFVLKTDDGRWLSWQQNHGQEVNFYAELPLPMP